LCRQQAIKDGFLVDVSKDAKEAGFSVPVAVTRALWNAIENIPPSKSWQDVPGRLWDLLWMGYLAARRHNGGGACYYKLIMHNGRKKYLVVKMTIGAACPTDPSPAVTIMLPNED